MHHDVTKQISSNGSSLFRSGIMKLLQENGKPFLAQDYDDLMQEEMNSYLRR